MNLPTIFNVAIGVVFIYLVLSLLASQVQEIVATLFELRAKHLTKAIEGLVFSDTKSSDSSEIVKITNLVDKLFQNPLIQSLDQTSNSLDNKKKNRNRKNINPSYIPPETFSSSILYELGIPKAARTLTWLNAKRLIHYEIYNRIDQLLGNDQGDQLEIEAIRPHYDSLKDCFKSVLDDYKDEIYGLSSTLIRLRNHVETFKRELNLPVEINPPQNTNSEVEITPLKCSINKIINFIFTTDKDDTLLVIRLRPSLTTVLDLLIPDNSEGAKPLCYKSFKEDLDKAKESENVANKSENSDELDLYNSFDYAQKYFQSISTLLPESLRKSLYNLALRSRIKASDTDKQLDHFKKEIETWFDRSMTRSSGVYKRNARGFTFLLGFVLAVTLNVDTFYIVFRLSKDDALRNSIVNSSSQLVQTVQSRSQPPTGNQSPITKTSSVSKGLSVLKPSSTTTPSPTSDSSLNTIEKVKDNIDQSLSDITLPIGWTDNILNEQLQLADSPPKIETPEETQKREKREQEKERRKAKFFGYPLPPLLIMLSGWFVTAIAIMMGAPFWFDFLGLFINVRNTGRTTESKIKEN
jgi:hypothetical protein